MADSAHPVTGIHPSLPYYMWGETAGEPDVSQLLRPDRPGKLPSDPAGRDPAETRRQLIEAGRQFEAYFVSYLLKVMRETVPQGVIANKPGAYFHSFYDQEIGLRAAESGGIGITAMIQDYARHNLAGSPTTPQVSAVKGR
jgi:peptidoglycan hydrolase FlgJ